MNLRELYYEMKTYLEQYDLHEGDGFDVPYVIETLESYKEKLGELIGEE